MAGDGVALDVPACKMRSTPGWPAWPLRTAIGATRECRTRWPIWAARPRGAPSPIFLRHSSDFFLTHSNRTQRDEALPSILKYGCRGTLQSVADRQGVLDFRNAGGRGFLLSLFATHPGVTRRGNGDQEKQKRSPIETHVPKSFSLLDHAGAQYSKNVQKPQTQGEQRAEQTHPVAQSDHLFFHEKSPFHVK